jgi:hypothetical protein
MTARHRCFLSRFQLPAGGRALLLVIAGAASASEPRLQPIFNGRDLAGWTVGVDTAASSNWRVEDGVLIGESNEQLKGSNLATTKSYRDFVLEFQGRWTGAEIDTGVILRSPQIQFQIGVSRSMERDMTGSWCLPPENPVRYPEAGQAKDWQKYFRPGEWNTYRVEARGGTFTGWINGQRVSQYADSKYAGPAPLRLQFHGGLKMKLEFRGIRLAEL